MQKSSVRFAIASCLLLVVMQRDVGGQEFVPPAGARPRSPQQGSKDAHALEPGQTISRELAGGETHTYRITLAANQFAKVVAEQQGVDLAMALLGGDGKRLLEMDGQNGVLGPEAITLVSETAGAHLVEIISPDKEAATGRYQLRIEELRAAVPGDRDQMAAQSLFAEGRRQMKLGTGDSLRAAVAKFEQTLPLWRAAHDRQKEVYALGFIGSAYDLLGEYQKALDYYFLQLPLTREIRDKVTEADALTNIGSEYYSLGDYPKALDYYNQSLVLGKDLGSEVSRAGTYNNMALIYQAQGDVRRAIEYFKLAVELLRHSGERSGLAITLQNLGAAYLDLDESRTALDYYEQSLQVSRAAEDRQTQSITISNIGAVYKLTGDLEQALTYYRQALDLSRAIGHRHGEAVTLNNIGGVYNSLGEGQTALEYLHQALPIWQATGERTSEARTLTNIGVSYSIIGDHQKALDSFKQALAIMRVVADPRAEAQALTNIGSAYDDLNEKQKALDSFNQALKLRRELDDRRGEALTLNHMGHTALSLGRTQDAFDYYARSLELSRGFKDRSLEAAALRGLARGARDRDDLNQARARMAEALTIIEGLRAAMASHDLRTSFFASVRAYYDLYIDLLMRLHGQQPTLGYDAAALQISERARARGLLELLSEARVDIRQGVEPTLLERERALQQKLNAKAERQTNLLNSKHTEEQAADMQRQLNELLTQYQEVEAQIRVNSPNYAALTRPEPLSPAEIQRQMLDADTVLLEYALGDERSYLWVVTPTSINSYALPPRAEVERAARRVYELLTARNRRVRFETADERRGRLAAADAAYWPAAAVLAQMILGPSAQQLGQKRLLIVSDGALDYIPFAALPMPLAEQGRPADASQATPTPLAVEHEIVSLPSASTLAALRHEAAARRRASKTLVVLADPVFDKDDERVRGGRIKPAARAALVLVAARTDVAEVVRSARETDGLGGDGRIVRLPYTRREAAEILALVPASERRGALDFDASKALATSAELAQYRFVHFATHGFLNSTHPELSGVVLSLVDRQGQEQNGFLRANEVFNLRLPADMVVLSGCSTGLGKEIRGEGLLGLTRGFMYAGAARVLVSVWGVSDEASSELMVRFYKAMLGREKLRPATALRAAQISMWREKRWRAPYYWAAFALHGEPR